MQNCDRRDSKILQGVGIKLLEYFMLFASFRTKIKMLESITVLTARVLRLVIRVLLLFAFDITKTSH